MSRAPKLFLMCGLPGSGKTTLAMELEKTHAALRLTPDEWMERLIGDGFDEKKRAEVETIQWEIAARLLSLGVSVILDFGFWSRAERDDFRVRAIALQAIPVLKFCNVPLNEIKKRLAMRNKNLPPNTFHVSDTDLETWSLLFEAPGNDELGGPGA